MEPMGIERHRRRSPRRLSERMEPAGSGATSTQQSGGRRPRTGKFESINRSPSSRTFLMCHRLPESWKPFPAGMEPTGVERHRRSPKGELLGESESIEAQAHSCTRVSKTHRTKEPFPAEIE